MVKDHCKKQIRVKGGLIRDIFTADIGILWSNPRDSLYGPREQEPFS